MTPIWYKNKLYLVSQMNITASYRTVLRCISALQHNIDSIHKWLNHSPRMHLYTHPTTLIYAGCYEAASNKRKFMIHTDNSHRGRSLSVCLSAWYLKKNDAARINKPDTKMIYHESWKLIYFTAKRSKVKVTMHKKQCLCQHGFLHSCECCLLLVCIGYVLVLTVFSVM